MGFDHASTPTQEYGDGSCVMGVGDGLFNAPHYLQLGWATPLASLHRDNFPADRWQLYIMPPVGSAKACALVIYPDWPMIQSGRPVVSPYTFVVSYRWAAGGDAQVSYSYGLCCLLPLSWLPAAAVLAACCRCLGCLLSLSWLPAVAVLAACCCCLGCLLLLSLVAVTCQSRRGCSWVVALWSRLPGSCISQL
jgi:hypothetical protein